MINHKYKFLYTHYPKCAGTSVRKYLLGNYSDGIDEEIEKIQYRHCSLDTTINRLVELAKDPDSYYKFSFCRNPWALCVSYYFFLRDTMYNHLKCKGLPQNNKTKFCYNNTFTDYIKSNLCESYFDKIYTFNNTFSIDFVIRQENLNADFKHVCDIIGIPHTSLSITHSTSHDEYRAYYTQETKQIVESKFAKEIDKFEYDYK